MKNKIQSQSHSLLDRPTEPPRARVLVLGDPSVGSYICRGLEKCGCKCLLARPDDDLPELIRSKDFVLIISTIPLEKDDPLLSELAASRCSVVLYQPATSDHCWIPIMNRGAKCLGALALRPRDFVELVRQATTELDESQQRFVQG